MELPATLSSAPARSQAPAGEEAYTDARQNAQAARRPAAFYSSVFAQIEEIGWERVVSAAGDDGVSCLTFRVVDEQGRVHLLEITLPMGYPASPPSITAEVPYLPKIQWSKSSRLKDVICQFQEHLKILQEFWSIMDEIDKVLWVVDPTKSAYAMSHRRLALGDDCYILLHVDPRKPSSLPECRFLGADEKLDRLIMNWRKNRRRWDTKKKFHENLACVLDFALPAPPSVNNVKEDEKADCGICYAKHLPVDDELGAHSGCATNYTCENPSCSRAFHSVCLRDWLRSITTTRQSFDVLFGNCPYCSDPVAVKVTNQRSTSLRGCVRQMESGGEGGDEKRQRRRRRRGRPWAVCLPRPGCFTVSAAGEDEGTSAAGADEGGTRPTPSHLVVTVNGIVGSAENWRFAAKHFIKKHPEDVVVHCSGCNSSARTFDGVDVMGRRLAEEVTSVVENRPELRKISFVAHSLGGLIARYAIALLYERDTQKDSHEECDKNAVGNPSNQHSSGGKIAGLEPINFITFATPHLGTRSHKQIPLLRGSYKLEKMAYSLSWIAGKSGKHLFLKDIEDEKPPLLLQMVTDYGGLHFMSALRSFKRRVVYSNVCSDFIVGWRTSSIRRQHELPERQSFINDGRYPHIVYVEEPKVQEVEFSDAMIYQAKSTSEMEEVMLKGLNRLPWERVDVSFKKSRQRFFAHSTIQVKTYFMNSDGADVIFHMIDHFIY
ncbi:uncharacterized protein LOC101757948 [Setaria italica]|nr:uncharacterized protein LOC101757948 [Setaria italica]